MDIGVAQRALCARIGAAFTPVDWNLKLGIVPNFATMHPANGLRHPAEATTCGWFLWSGEELKDDAGFFESMHAYHVRERFPFVATYLALPPGWRFLIAPGHEDVWFDEQLLGVSER